MEPNSCRIIRGGGSYVGKQGLTYFAGVSAENTGAQRLCLQLLVIPPSGRAKAHLHADHESAIFLVEGEVDVWWGERLGEHDRMSSGDFIYIPPGLPHLPVNASSSEPSPPSWHGRTPTNRKAWCSVPTSTPWSPESRPNRDGVAPSGPWRCSRCGRHEKSSPGCDRCSTSWWSSARTRPSFPRPRRQADPARWSTRVQGRAGPRLDELMTRVQQAGADIKGFAPLLLDFPAELAGEPVLLCWLEGDPELAWYHRLDLGFAGRRRLP